MADFSQPTVDTLDELVLSQLKDQIASLCKMFQGTSDTNLPDTTIRYEPASDTWQRKSGDSWTELPFHAAIAAAIAAVQASSNMPPGALLDWAGATLPSGYLWADGSAVSRTDYAALFTNIGTTHGVGNGSTTFNLPDARGRFKLGRAASGSYQTLGQTGGLLNHTHSTPSHQHDIATHSHTMGNHTHPVSAHQHSIPAHSHSVPGHYHDANLGGADIQIISSGSHQHSIAVRSGGAIGSNVDVLLPASAGASGGPGHTISNSDSAHTHPHSSIIGTVGYKTGGISGDGPMATATDGSGTTVSAGGGNTTGPSTNSTEGSGTLTTTSGQGGSTSGGADPAYLICNVIIKY